MRKHLSAFALLILIVTTIGCSKNDNIPQAFSIVDSLIFGCTFPAFSQYEDGKYYTADSFDCTIKVFEDGEFINSFGGKGGGPGEFDSCPVITLTDEHIIATTYSASRISIFSKEGDFLYSNPMECNDFLLALPALYFLDNRIIASGATFTGKGEMGAYIGELNLNGKLTKLTENIIQDDHSFINIYPTTVVADQVLYYQDNSLYFSKLDKTYSLNAIPTKLISAECRAFMKEMEEYNSKKSIPLNFPKYKQAFELDNRIFVQSQFQYYDYLMKRGNRVYELDLESGDLTEVELPEELNSSKWFITSGNRFMVLDEDEEQIREYEVKGL